METGPVSAFHRSFEKKYGIVAIAYMMYDTIAMAKPLLAYGKQINSAHFKTIMTLRQKIHSLQALEVAHYHPATHHD